MKTFFSPLLLAALCAAGASPLYAADNDRGTSIYDQNPECMDRTQANNPKCTIQNGRPPMKVIGATQGKGPPTGTTTGTGTGTGQTSGGTGTQGSGNTAGKGSMAR